MDRRKSIGHFRRQSSQWKKRISQIQMIPQMELNDVPQTTIQHNQSGHINLNTKFEMPPNFTYNRSHSVPNGLDILRQSSDHSDSEDHVDHIDHEVSDNDGHPRHKLTDYKSNTRTLPTIPDHPDDDDDNETDPPFYQSSPYTNASTASPYRMSSHSGVSGITNLTLDSPHGIHGGHGSVKRKRHSFFGIGRNRSSSTAAMQNGRSNTKSTVSSGSHHRRRSSMLKFVNMVRNRTAPQQSPTSKEQHQSSNASNTSNTSNASNISNTSNVSKSSNLRNPSNPENTSFPRIHTRIARQRSKSDQPPRLPTSNSNQNRIHQRMMHFKKNLSPRARSTHTSPRKKSNSKESRGRFGMIFHHILDRFHSHSFQSVASILALYFLLFFSLNRL